MSEVAMPRFACKGCGKTFAVKPEWAGKKVKCHCGFVMSVPQAPKPSADHMDDLYDLAPEGSKPKVKAVVAPVAMSAAAPAVAATTQRGAAVASPVLGYRTRATAEKEDRFSSTSSTLMDKKRDVYVPTALLVAGLILNVAYYAFHHSMGVGGVAIATLGISVLTAFKAALLIGFAFAVAGPLGVSFGGIFTAVLKLAAIAVFSDGVTTWVEAGLEAAGSGGLSSLISFPVALACYWVLLIYLFSMDPGDSWLVVMLLAVFDQIVRWALLAVLMSTILGWGGVSSVGLRGSNSGGANAGSPMAAHVADLKDQGLLQEFRSYAKSHQVILADQATAFYAAGAKTVWLEVSWDINRKPSIHGMIVELPMEKDKRAQCFRIRNDYYKARFGEPVEEDLADTDEPYMDVSTD